MNKPKESLTIAIRMAEKAVFSESIHIAFGLKAVFDTLYHIMVFTLSSPSRQA